MANSSHNFGLLVAYLLPGFIGLVGIAPLVPLVSAWLQPGTYAEASIGPPIYAVLAATTVGMILSSVRWLVIDHALQLLGVRPPVWDDTRLVERVNAFNYLVENHYRYYQFFANGLIALIFAYSINRFLATSALLGIGTDVAFLGLCAVLFAASRDALQKYYTRTTRLIGHALAKRSGE